MPLASVLFAFVVGALVVTVTGGNPIDAYQGLLCGGLGIACTQGENSALQIANTIVFAIPLITAGVAVALPFRAGLFNIGAEGQMLAGAMACTALGIKLHDWPAVILLPTVMVGGMLAGARLATFRPNSDTLQIFGRPASVYRVHVGLVIAVVAVAVFAVLLWRTSL